MFIHVIENESEDPELGAELFNVSFDLDGGSGYVHEQNVVRGGKPAAVRHPTMEGYYFCRGVPPYGETFLIARDTVDDDLVLKAVWKKSPEAGDRGPGDGVIFYVSDEIRQSEYTDTTENEQTLEWKYLEAAPEDTAREKEWENGWHKTQTDIGTGWSNTGKLKTSGIKDFPAAEACTTYSNNGLDDWFLPSRKELGAFYEACKTNANVKTIAPECKSGSSWLYRTSSEDTTASAWKQYFNGDGFHDFIHRAGRYRVRPVRAFM